MGLVILMQAWLAWNFICYQIKIWREHAANTASPSKKKEIKKKNKKDVDKKKKEELVDESDEDEGKDTEKKNGSPKTAGKQKKA